MPSQGIEDQAPAPIEHGVLVPEDEHGPDAVALAPLPGDLDGEVDDTEHDLPGRAPVPAKADVGEQAVSGSHPGAHARIS
jgi:hypothetical protein